MKRKEKSIDFSRIVVGYLLLLVMDYGPLAGIVPMMVLMKNAEKIGPWWIFLFLTLLSVFLVLTCNLERHKHLREYEYFGGTELLYRTYPEVMKKVLRHKRKEQKAEGTVRTIEYYRTRMKKAYAYGEEQYIRYKRNWEITFYVAAIVFIGLAGHCAYRLFFRTEAGGEMDFARVMRMLTVVMMTVCSIYAVLKINMLVYNAITSILLLFIVLSDVANYLLMPHTHSFMPAAEDAAILAIFSVVVIILQSVIRRKQTIELRLYENAQTNILLYELGVIDEKELAFRFGE